MKIRITGRRMEITPALQQYLETRFERLDRYGLKVGSVQVVLGVEKLQHKAEAVCSVNGKRVQAKTSTREMYATIDALVDRVDAQLRKWKDRLVSHKPGKLRRARMEPAEPLQQDRADRVAVERQAVQTLSIEQAREQFAASSSPFLLFVNAETGALQVMQRLTGGRLSVIEPQPQRDRERVLSSRTS